ncbi:MAG: hypothetical protein ACTSX9_05040 [Candidatus Njordarchaeales archaeon]
MIIVSPHKFLTVNGFLLGLSFYRLARARIHGKLLMIMNGADIGLEEVARDEG